MGAQDDKIAAFKTTGRFCNFHFLYKKRIKETATTKADREKNRTASGHFHTCPFLPFLNTSSWQDAAETNLNEQRAIAGTKFSSYPTEICIQIPHSPLHGADSAGSKR